MGKRDDQTVLDIPYSVGMDIFGKYIPGLGGTVQLRILQPELTSLLIGLIVMIFFKPRTWCAFCPMGTMTQAICKLRNRKRGK